MDRMDQEQPQSGLEAVAATIAGGARTMAASMESAAAAFAALGQVMLDMPTDEEGQQWIASLREGAAPPE